MMIKKVIAASVAIVVAALSGLGGYEMSVAQDAKAKPAAPNEPKAAALPENNTSDLQLSPDEDAIRKNGAAFVQAYEVGDAKALAAHFTPDGECVQDSAVCCSGSAAIEEY